MYNQNYEDYMHNVLGGYRSDTNVESMNTMYNMENANTMYNTANMNQYDMANMNTYNTVEEFMQAPNQPLNQPSNQLSNQLSDAEIEKLYPEVYRLVNPMVMKVCEENRKPITQETIGEMTKTVQSNFEGEANIGINVKTELKNGDVINPRSKENTKETRSPSYLEDLITILIIRNLLGSPRPPQPGPRPPYPPRPPQPGPGPRPPYPPRPPQPGPGPRPPYPPRPPQPGPGPRPPYPPRPPQPGPGPRPPYVRSEDTLDQYNNYDWK